MPRRSSRLTSSKLRGCLLLPGALLASATWAQSANPETNPPPLDVVTAASTRTTPTAHEGPHLPGHVVAQPASTSPTPHAGSSAEREDVGTTESTRTPPTTHEGPHLPGHVVAQPSPTSPTPHAGSSAVREDVGATGSMHATPTPPEGPTSLAMSSRNPRPRARRLTRTTLSQLNLARPRAPSSRARGCRVPSATCPPPPWCCLARRSTAAPR